MLRLAFALGTRPEAIKLAPLYHALRHRSDRFRVRLWTTGQHRELLEPVLTFFRLVPDRSGPCGDVDLGRNFACLVETLAAWLASEAVDALVVQGDTLTAFAGAFVGFLRPLPVLHVEAGLRTGQRFAPFPEEMLRRLLGVIADIHFAPTPRVAATLLREGVPRDRVVVTGNTVVDALQMARSWLARPAMERALCERLDLCNPDDVHRPWVLVTAHRRENIGEPLKGICRAVERLAIAHPEAVFLWSLHRNPAVRAAVLREFAHAPPNVRLVEAFSYPEMIYLLERCAVVLTDSGGIQEEAPTFGTPVLVLRQRTERDEAVEAGFADIVGTDQARIVAAFDEVYGDPTRRQRLLAQPNPYGDGRACERILALLDDDDVQAFFRTYREDPHRDLALPRRCSEFRVLPADEGPNAEMAAGSTAERGFLAPQ